MKPLIENDRSPRPSYFPSSPASLAELRRLARGTLGIPAATADAGGEGESPLAIGTDEVAPAVISVLCTPKPPRFHFHWLMVAAVGLAGVAIGSGAFAIVDHRIAGTGRQAMVASPLPVASSDIRTEMVAIAPVSLPTKFETDIEPTVAVSSTASDGDQARTTVRRNHRVARSDESHQESQPVQRAVVIVHEKTTAEALRDPARPVATAEAIETPPDADAKSLEELMDSSAGDLEIAEHREVRTDKKELTRSDIKNVMARAQGDVRSCSETHGGPSQITVRLSVAPSGEVIRARIAGSNASFVACSHTALKGLHFGAYEGRPTTFSYPLWLD